MASEPQPQQFGKYSLIERIAVGGMAEVYRAKTYGAAGFEKDLVIKRILEKFSGDDEFVRMFIDEARLAVRLQHPNLVQIFDFDRVETAAGPSYYIAMEWVDGKDLRQLLREMVRQKHPISYPAAVHIAVETLRALHHAHTKTEAGKPLGIVHRDVSPHNILVSYSGDVKLSDFGIAKAAARASATSNGMVKGKLAYMSPEQITGQVLDCRSDVFSLGIVLFEMLTRTRLFSGASEVEVIAKVRDGLVPPPRSRNPDIPADVEQVLLKMLARDLRLRFQTAAEAARALAATSAHASGEDLALGDFVAALFPPGQQSAGVDAAPPLVLPLTRDRKSEIMANQSSNPPSGKPPQGPGEIAGASTVMLEAPQVPPGAPGRPGATPVAEQKTAILEADSPQMASVQAQIAEARARTPGAPPAAYPPAGGAQTPIAEQRTAIIDTGSPQMASVQSQIAEARARAPGASPPAAAAAPIGEQRTAILDTSSPQMASVQAQLAGARAGTGAPPPAAARPMAEQKTAILDLGSPAHASAAAQLGAPRAPAAPGGGGRGGGEQRTMALDVSAQLAVGGRESRQHAQALAPLAPRKAPSSALRWVLGPLIALLTCGVTYAAAGALLPRKSIEKPFVAKPAPPPVMGHIKLDTSPPGASVLVNGKPHPHFTPTEIEGPVGDSTAHVAIRLEGFQPWEQDVLFAKGPQRLSIALIKVETDTRRGSSRHGGGGGSSSATPAAGARERSAGSGGGGSGMAPVGDKGMLGIFVEPEAYVTIDGQAVGKTPIGSLTLKPGRHVIELTNEKLGKREKVNVEVKAGDNPPLRRSWTH